MYQILNEYLEAEREKVQKTDIIRDIFLSPRAITS
jgi:hypothetical protein